MDERMASPMPVLMWADIVGIRDFFYLHIENGDFSLCELVMIMSRIVTGICRLWPLFFFFQSSILACDRYVDYA